MVAWLGCAHSVFVNSGSSANLLTMAALADTRGPGEVIVPTLTWVSDIASMMQAGFEPVFVDIDAHTLGMDTDQVLRPSPRGRGRCFSPTCWVTMALDDRQLAG